MYLNAQTILDKAQTDRMYSSQLIMMVLLVDFGKYSEEQEKWILLMTKVAYPRPAYVKKMSLGVSPFSRRAAPLG